MAAGDPEKLAKLWETATPLHTHAVEKATLKWRQALTGSPWPRVSEGFSANAFLKSPEFQEQLPLAQDETLQELAAGRIVGFGQQSDSKRIERISRSFWAQAQVDDWLRGGVSSNGTKFGAVRIKRTRPASRQQLPEDRAATEQGIPPKSLVGRRRVRKSRRKQWVSKPTSAPGVLAQQPKTKKPVGRPNTRNEIIEKTQELWETREFRMLPIKGKVLAVRGALLGEDCRDEERRGYTSPSMTKTIGRTVNALREKAKRNKSTKA